MAACRASAPGQRWPPVAPSSGSDRNGGTRLILRTSARSAAHRQGWLAYSCRGLAFWLPVGDSAPAYPPDVLDRVFTIDVVRVKTYKIGQPRRGGWLGFAVTTGFGVPDLEHDAAIAQQDRLPRCR